MESISSVDRDLSPEEIDIMQKVSSMHHTEQEQQRSGWKITSVCVTFPAGGGDGERDVPVGMGGDGKSGE